MEGGLKGRSGRLLWAAAALVIGIFTGGWGKQARIDADADALLSGSIKMAGSTSMEKLADALAESFMDKYPDVNVTVQFVGSSAGIRAVAADRADIGNSSRSLKEEERALGLVENIIALEGIAICVDPTNTVTGLTKKQLEGIYTGRITNWLAVGGADIPIVVVGREAGSGTRGAFEELLGIENQCIYANELDGAGAVLARVAATPGAIGYISFDAINDAVIPLAIEGAEPTAENIKTGSYYLASPLIMATKGSISSQNSLVRKWFDYVYGEEGKSIMANLRFVPVD